MLAFCWTAAVVAFLVCRDWQKLEVSEMPLCLGAGVQILLRHNRNKLDTISVLQSRITELSYVVHWIFFQMSDRKLNILSKAVSRNRLLLDSKKDLTTRGLILMFSDLNMPRLISLISAWSEICKNGSVSIVFWGHQKFMIFSLMGFLVRYSILRIFFSHWTL